MCRVFCCMSFSNCATAGLESPKRPLREVVHTKPPYAMAISRPATRPRPPRPPVITAIPAVEGGGEGEVTLRL